MYIDRDAAALAYMRAWVSINNHCGHADSAADGDALTAQFMLCKAPPYSIEAWLARMGLEICPDEPEPVEEPTPLTSEQLDQMAAAGLKVERPQKELEPKPETETDSQDAGQDA